MTKIPDFKAKVKLLEGQEGIPETPPPPAIEATSNPLSHEALFQVDTTSNPLSHEVELLYIETFEWSQATDWPGQGPDSEDTVFTEDDLVFFEDFSNWFLPQQTYLKVLLESKRLFAGAVPQANLIVSNRYSVLDNFAPGMGTVSYNGYTTSTNRPLKTEIDNKWIAEFVPANPSVSSQQSSPTFASIASAGSYTIFIKARPRSPAGNVGTGTINEASIYGAYENGTARIRDTGSGPEWNVTNNDGTTQEIGWMSCSYDTWQVFEYRHESGNLYARLDKGTEYSVASGNTADMTKTVYLGWSGIGGYFNGYIESVVVYNIALSEADRNLVVDWLMSPDTLP
jgi:hypothetical protein